MQRGALFLGFSVLKATMRGTPAHEVIRLEATMRVGQ
jgi:hypothetical protein